MSRSDRASVLRSPRRGSEDEGSTCTPCWPNCWPNPPEWMSLPGREWPLFDLLTRLAAKSDAARLHLDLVAGIPSEEVDQRRQRYASLFQAGCPHFWLYESAARTGKILGEPTFAMAQLLQAAGLETAGAELPNHVSLELAFLSNLVGQIGNLSYEKQFLDQHGAWMIDLKVLITGIPREPHFRGKFPFWI